MNTESRARSPIMMIAAVALLTVAAAGTGALVAKRSSSPSAEPERPERRHPAKKSHGPAVVVPLEEFTVNLADTNELRYLRVTMSLELADPEAKTTVEHEMHRIRDAVIAVISRHTMDELATPIGKKALKNELVSALNSALDEELIDSVFFTEFAMQ
ncbi:MAG: flagellar basal body-associated FliL family protein [Armatimonadota bacterium]